MKAADGSMRRRRPQYVVVTRLLETYPFGCYATGAASGIIEAVQRAKLHVELFCAPHAKVAELADAPDLGSGSRKAMGVRVPPFAL